VPEGTALLAEAFDRGWTATGGGRALEHRAAFAWVNAWDHPDETTVAISHDGQGRRYLLLGVELVAWIVALVWWTRGRGRERAARVERLRQERLQAAPRPSDFLRESELGGLDDLDGFWEEQ
jgi:hypothetical protein